MPPNDQPIDQPDEGLTGQPDDRSLASDLTLPVPIEPGLDYAQPPEWSWRNVSSSRPNAAVFHISHSEASRVLVDVLRPSDSAPDANFVVRTEIPIVVLDSLDKYWAGEAKNRLPLSGVRVPVEADTLAEAKRALANDLAAQLRLLLLLSGSHQGRIAPALLENLRMLASFLEPAPGPTGNPRRTP